MSLPTFRMGFYYVYVLLSELDNRFYIGYTHNIGRRFQEHQAGKNISTKFRRPLILIYFEGHRAKTDALRRESYFKTTKGKRMLRKILQSSLS